MLGNTLREFIHDSKVMFRRWNLLFFLIYSGMMIVLNKIEGDEVSGLLVLYFTMYCTIIMKPKVNKLHYILPSEEKSRQSYILIKSFGVFLFIALWYIMMLGIITSLSEYQFMVGLKRMFCEVIPLVIVYVSTNMNNGYNTKSPKKGVWAKKIQFRYVMSYLILFILMMYMLLFSQWIRGGWYIVFTIAGYLCAMLVLYWKIMILKHLDTSYDNIIKVEKFFN
ncbi:MAG: hypothetical protein ACYDEX_16905 [Mobilitalea sp.]